MKKKVVFFIGGLNYGGMERVVFIAEKLLRDIYDIKIVTLYQENADYEVKKEYYNIDIPPSKNKLKIFIRRLIGTIKMKKELKPDIVFSFGMYLNYLNIISDFFGLQKTKKIVGIRSYDWLLYPFFNKKIDKWIIKKADKVNSVSKEIAEKAEEVWKIDKNKNNVIYNPYNIEEIEEKSKEKIDDFIFDDDYYYIVTAGRLVDQKGFNHLIRAINEVININHEIKIKVLILGNGSRKKDLENMIMKYNLQDTVILLGGKKNPLKYMKKANLYVMSSLNEGFPNALAEAMCIGTPIVTVNCKSGPLELLNEEKFIYKNEDFYICDYGILSKELVPDKNYSKKNISLEEKALSKAILYAYNHKEKMQELAIKAKENMKKYNYDIFKENLIKELE